MKIEAYPSRDLSGPFVDAKLAGVKGRDIDRGVSIRERFGIQYDRTKPTGQIAGVEVFAVTDYNILNCVINGKKFTLQIDQIIPSQNKLRVSGFFDEKGENKGLPRSFPEISIGAKTSGWTRLDLLGNWLEILDHNQKSL